MIRLFGYIQGVIIQATASWNDYRPLWKNTGLFGLNMGLFRQEYWALFIEGRALWRKCGAHLIKCRALLTGGGAVLSTCCQFLRGKGTLFESNFSNSCLMQCTATHCNTLQHTATHCNAPVANCYGRAPYGWPWAMLRIHISCNKLIHTALHRYTLATLCNTLQHTATHCNTPVANC